MMSIFFIFVMCSYLYSVCLVFRFLRNAYFKEHLSIVTSKYSTCDDKQYFIYLSNTKAILKNMFNLCSTYVNLCSMLKNSPNGKEMVYDTNEI